MVAKLNSAKLFKEVRSSIKRCQAIQAKIAKFRDQLRNEVETLDDIVETLDVGSDYIESGLRELTDGLDKYSEQL